MAKPNPLSAGLAGVVARAQPPAPAPARAANAPAPSSAAEVTQASAPSPKPPAKATRAQEAQAVPTSLDSSRSGRGPARAGRVMVGGFFDPATHKQLRMLAVKTDRTQQDLLAEALDLLFASHGELQIARLGLERE